MKMTIISTHVLKLKTVLLFLLLLFSFAGFSQLTILIDSIPHNTPVSDNIFIAGDFQGWNPGDPMYKLKKHSSGFYSILLHNIPDQIQFKFTRGSWDKVESDENGNFIANRSYFVSNLDTIFTQIKGWEDLNGNGNNQNTKADNVYLISDSFYIPQLDRYRRIWIYLPPDYYSSMQNYPVLYMHDGQNIFDVKTSYAGEWNVDESLNKLFDNDKKGIIVVAIDNGKTLRINEYCPWKNSEYGGGEGGKYIDFIAKTLKPYVDQNYRTLSDRNNTGLMGSSLGGLISLYGGIKYQEIFSKIGIFSPAYWINPEIFDYILNTGIINKIKIYQIIGSEEGDSAIQNTVKMKNKLIEAGLNKENIFSSIIQGGKHNESFWSSQFIPSINWLFSGYLTSYKKQIKNVNTTFKIYPNPVKDTINIQFDLKRQSDISIAIHDSSGKKIKTLFQGNVKTGLNVFAFNIKKFNLKSENYILNFYENNIPIFSKLIIITN